MADPLGTAVPAPLPLIDGDPMLPTDAPLLVPFALDPILERIPNEFGKWIGCRSGWYPLLLELDARLAAICPEYQVHQVKEKYGTLRYYFDLPTPQPQCCEAFDLLHPRMVPPPWKLGRVLTEEEQSRHDAWLSELNAHFASDEHGRGCAEVEPVLDACQELNLKMEEVVREYEQRSAHTCELCGGEGTLGVSGGWYQTLCAPCRAEK